jgi:hypothetical protein
LRTAAFAIPRNDLTAVRLYELPSDGKPEADASGSRSWTAIKLFEHLGLFTSRKARTMIRHRNGKHRAITRSAHFDRFTASTMRGGV